MKEKKSWLDKLCAPFERFYEKHLGESFSEDLSQDVYLARPRRNHRRPKRHRPPKY